MKRFQAVAVMAVLACSCPLWAAEPTGGFYSQGEQYYKAGRFSDAVDSFDQSIKHKERAKDAQDYIDRIRKETVERIRNKALTGVNKANWQSKFYYMNEADKRIHVGISAQELFEHDSLNFRPGAVSALNDLAAIFAKADTARFDVELINELNTDAPSDPSLTTQQLTAVFSYLSLASRDNLPKL